MQWSSKQEAALAQVADWIQNGDNQVFKMFGYAGTGKTTLARHLAEGVNGPVYFGAFTGKAAHVLQSKGCAARTIHSLIYRQRDKGRAALRELEEELAELRRELAADGLSPEAIDEHRRVKDVQRLVTRERESLAQPLFQLNPDSDLRDAALVVIDECSMVDERMGEDLLSFGVKVLVLGDPAQLPPVKGEGFFTSGKPDIMLDEIHRQASDNPIIAMATTIRRGDRLAPGAYGTSHVLTMDEFRADRDRARALALDAHQVLVGRNATRESYNARLRQLHGYTGTYPNHGEKVVCLRNNHEIGLLNGAIWYVDTIEAPEDDRILMTLLDGDREVSVEAHAHHFDGRSKDLPWWQKNEAEEFTYGYALTCHKAQGSQWDRVLVIDESRFFREHAARWLYTAVTRAAESVTVIQP